MAIGDSAEVLIAGITENLIGPFGELTHSRSREGTMQGIGFGEEADVG